MADVTGDSSSADTPRPVAQPDASAARAVADAVLAVPGVTGLHGGVFGEIATYLPGSRISGVIVDDDAVEVHIIVDVHHDLRAVAEQVRDVANDVVGLPASVTVEDISVTSDRGGDAGVNETGTDQTHTR